MQETIGHVGFTYKRWKMNTKGDDACGRSRNQIPETGKHDDELIIRSIMEELPTRMNLQISNMKFTTMRCPYSIQSFYVKLSS